MPRIDPFGDATFTYLQVANDIAARIAAGEFTRRLPPERELARQYSVAYSTVRRAMKELRERGVVASRQGDGTLVVQRAPDAQATR
jgi:DNA-binding GntR family transcriptional regulator